MKTWEKYKKYLLKGEWHIHTNYTDGKNSIFEYCENANELGIPLIAFTEHVRKNLDYDFNEFLEDIEKARKEFPEIVILSGCEAKVLPSGELNTSEKNLRKVDFPAFAFHSFPVDLDLYLRRVKTVIKNKFVNAWSHPGLFLKKHELTIGEKDLTDILGLMKKKNVLLEMNRKYGLPPKYWNSLIEKTNVYRVRGDDIHSISEMR